MDPQRFAWRCPTCDAPLGDLVVPVERYDELRAEVERVTYYKESAALAETILERSRVTQCPDPMAHEKCYCQDGRTCWKHRRAR